MSTAFIGIGSNLAQPVVQVRSAVSALAAMPGCRLIAASDLFRSPPMGPQDQPDFVNAVAMLATGLAPMELLDGMQAIESAHQRQRDRHWGPRTLDLDLLSVDDRVLVSERLRLPHPGIVQRAFVLVPWAELAPDYAVPGLGRVRNLRARIDDRYLERLPQEGMEPFQ